MKKLTKSLSLICAFVLMFSFIILFSACKKEKPEPEIYSATVSGLQFKALRTNWEGYFIHDIYHIWLDFSVENISEGTIYVDNTLFSLKTSKEINFDELYIQDLDKNLLSVDDGMLEAGEKINFYIHFYFQPTDDIETLVNQNTFTCEYNNVTIARMKMEGSAIK